uniref:Uncharacterized protein n=1 Tax=Rhipicephalus microplus TaxID=6941 RepID=A0A6M2DBA3_RHIMP
MLTTLSLGSFRKRHRFFLFFFSGVQVSTSMSAATNVIATLSAGALGAMFYNECYTMFGIKIRHPSIKNSRTNVLIMI